MIISRRYNASPFCAAVSLADVTSANIVGYATQELQAGNKTVNGTPFVVVGGGSYNITEILPKANGEPAPDGLVEMSWYDYNKNGFRFVTWYDDLYDEEDQELGRSGWAEDLDNQRPPKDEKDINFTAGDWFFLAVSDGIEKPTLTVAGQLYTSDSSKMTVSLPAQAGTKIRAANPLPVSTKLTEIIPMSEETTAPDGLIEMSWYDYGKNGFRFVTWYDDLYDEDDQELGRAGWAEDLDNQRPPKDEKDIVFEAGRGFFIAFSDGIPTPWVAFPNPFSAK